MQTYDVAVVGLGAMGGATLHALAKRGIRAIGFERFEPGHDRGSSHGESRIIRLSYFEHPSYVPLLRHAYEAWRALERDSGETILTETGILEAGHPGSAVVGGSLDASRLHAIPHELLDAAAIRARFPAFDLPDGWTGLFQPRGGFLRPEAAVRAFAAQARRHGATVRTGARVLDIRPGPAAITVRTEAETVEAGSVVVAAGAWIGGFAPELAPHLTLTRQVLGWFKPREPKRVALGALPVFILDAPDTAFYGFPDFAGTGVKAAVHAPCGTLAHADDLRQDAGDADEAPLRALLARYVPAAAGPLARMRTCLYTRAPDEFFTLDRSAADPRIVLASPCSGHGFKFASAIGEVLADLATAGSTPHDISRFRLDRLKAPPQGDTHP